MQMLSIVTITVCSCIVEETYVKLQLKVVAKATSNCSSKGFVSSLLLFNHDLTPITSNSSLQIMLGKISQCTTFCSVKNMFMPSFEPPINE